MTAMDTVLSLSYHASAFTLHQSSQEPPKYSPLPRLRFDRIRQALSRTH